MRISIITVCLNSEKTIEQTIQSVVKQKDDEIEYIIVDGNSTDRTLEIIDKYKKDISVIVSEPDNGIYDAMNKGIFLASGEIIGIINSDDWYEPGVFKIVKACFQKSNVEVVYGNMNLIYENGKLETLIPSDIEKIRYEMEVPHSTVFVRKEIYKKYGVFQLDYKIAADYELILRLYTKRVKFSYENKIFANFRLGGISNQQGEECERETLLIAEKYLPYAPLNKRKYLRNIFLHRYSALCFSKIVKDFSHLFIDILVKKLGVGFNDDIVIFGAGVWGIEVCKLLLKNNFQILFFVDNDKQKWDKIENSLKILSPEILKSFQGVLLLVIKEHSNDILNQIEKMKNPNLYPIAWEEIVAELQIY